MTDPKGRGKSGPTKIRSMSEIEFEALRPLMKNLSDDRLDAARAALVAGESFAVIAPRHGWKSRQAVGSVVAAVWDKHLQFQEAMRLMGGLEDLPEGWERVTIDAPKELVSKFLVQVEKAKKKPGPLS